MGRGGLGSRRPRQEPCLQSQEVLGSIQRAPMCYTTPNIGTLVQHHHQHRYCKNSSINTIPRHENNVINLISAIFYPSYFPTMACENSLTMAAEEGKGIRLIVVLHLVQAFISVRMPLPQGFTKHKECNAMTSFFSLRFS